MEDEMKWELTLGELIEVIGTVIDKSEFPCSFPSHLYTAKTVVEAVEQEKGRN